MGDLYKLRLAGHALRVVRCFVDGMPYALRRDYGRCECGAQSPTVLMTVEERRLWHQNHKADMRGKRKGSRGWQDAD